MARWKVTDKEWDALVALRFSTADVGSGAIQVGHRPGTWLLPGHGGQHSQTISRAGAGWFDAAEVHGSPLAGHAGVSRGTPPCGVGKHIILVCDNGRFHKTKAVEQWRAEHRDQITIYWLPAYSPSLNLIERLWGHLKRTVLANVLYESLDDLVGAFRHAFRRLTGNRDAMGFMYNHDDLTQELRRAAA